MGHERAFNAKLSTGLQRPAVNHRLSIWNGTSGGGTGAVRDEQDVQVMAAAGFVVQTSDQAGRFFTRTNQFDAGALRPKSVRRNSSKAIVMPFS
jgi:hypothetical protein